MHVVAITISKEQHKYATTTDLEPSELAFLRVPTLAAPSEKGSFEFRLQDYRDVEETFDRIVSVGMFEHVGIGNYEEYFQVNRVLSNKQFDCDMILIYSLMITGHQL